jgi:hypothetical protein
MASDNRQQETQCANQLQNKNFKVHLNTVHDALKIQPMTMKEIDVFTGIMRESICRYISILLEQGKIAVTWQRKCSITKHRKVKEFTADKNLFPKSNQLTLF